jgi:hypothetical protein
MTKFDVNERVIFNHEGAWQRGKVTRIQPKLRRVVTDSGRRLVVPVQRLKLSPDRALILETRLDRNLRSRRAYGPMMQQWLRAFNVEALYEHVHTIEDMHRFLQKEGRNVATRFIHIIGHGIDDSGSGKAALRLTFEKLPLGERADIFAGLVGKVIIFSSCWVGSDRGALRKIKQASGASAVIAYRISVNDWYTNVAEGLLYERLINSPNTPQTAVRLVTEALALLGAKVPGVVTRKPVLVCV